MIHQVTFAEEYSVRDVLESLPFILCTGKELTVTLAASNAKPRRAHFTVKHGVSGHKSLPQNPGENLIYDDPSLLRTINIQPIEPAKLVVDDDENEVSEAFSLSFTMRSVYSNHIIYIYIYIDCV